MKHFGNYLLLAFSAAFIFGCGCSTTNSGKNISAFASPSELTETLTNGNNVVLHWKNNSTAEGGNWVEFATPGSEYVQLDVFMSDAIGTTFVHPRLAPQTTFIYQIHPFFGKAAGPIGITTGISTSNAPALGEGPIVSTNEISFAEKNQRYSIRSLKTFSKAAPTDFTAILSSPTSVDLRWKDNASDEDGYLLEIAASATGKFYACALLPSDTTSFRKTGLPPNTKCYFRVRAYFYGKPSDSVSVTTPKW
jgi:hypothetical protein